MSLWIELHCDAQVARGGANEINCPQNQRWDGPRCANTTNDYPSAHARNRTVLDPIWRLIKADAITRGWTIHKRRWACKNCTRLLKSTERKN